MNIDFSNPTTVIVIASVALLIVLTIVAIALKRRRTSATLRSRFGSEYNRTVLEQGSPRKAEAVLAEREARVQSLKLRDLAPAQRDRFITDWSLVQSRFLDHPKGSLLEADELVSSLMQARGYPVSSFEESAADISVHFPHMIEEYRSAHSVVAGSADVASNTEELRAAMIQYRTLFDELIASAPLAYASSVA